MKGKRRLGILGLGLLLLPLAACMAAPSTGDRTTVRWTGTVEAIRPDGLQVSGQQVRWTGQTQILGEIRVGSPVEVEGIQVDGAVNALVIRAQPAEGSVEFRGIVEAIQPDGYRIAGRTVIVTATTQIEGPIAVGSLVEVHGIPQPDGIILARRIHREEEDRPDIEFTGIIEAALPNGYRISGQTVIVTATTQIEGPIAVGNLVEVQGIPQPDGTIEAIRIRLKGEVRFEGVVEAIRPDGYRVSGHTVVVTGTTRVKGPIAVGDWVEVEGFLQGGGQIIAREIRVRKAPQAAEVEFKGHVEAILTQGYRIGGRAVVVTSTTWIDGPITVGTFVEVEGILQADGSVLARRIHVEEEEREIEFKGHVEEVRADGYRIAGRVVRVDANTRLDGPITAGAFVEVKGILQADGSIRAIRIHLEDRSGDDSGSLQKGEDGQREEDREGGEDRHEEDAHEDQHED